MTNFQFYLSSFFAILFLAAPFIGAAVFGIGLPIMLVVGSVAIGRLQKSTRLIFILGSIILGSAISTALSGRVLYSDHDLAMNPFLGNTSAGSVWGVRASQLFTAASMFVVLCEIFLWVFGQSKLNARSLGIWIFSFALFMVSVVVSGFFGEYRQPQFHDFYFPFYLAALTILAAGCDVKFWGYLRLALLVPIVGSIVAALVSPKFALMSNYASLIPGVSQRLYGLTDHANSLGMIAAIAIAIELCPMVRSRPAIILLFFQFAVLLLAQSKTAWLAVVLIIPIVRWSWFKDRLSSRDAWRSSAVLLVIGITIAMILIIILGWLTQSSSVRRFAAINDIDTFTGRLHIWGVTMHEFFKSPYIGYGPSLWDPQFRIERGIYFAGQAHNQFVQMLGQAGVAGMIAMLAYLASLLKASVQGRQNDHGLALALFTVVLVRCFSESPLRMMGVMDWENFMHLLLFLTVAAAAAGLKPMLQASAVENPMADGGLRPSLGLRQRFAGRGPRFGN